MVFNVKRTKMFNIRLNIIRKMTFNDYSSFKKLSYLKLLTNNGVKDFSMDKINENFQAKL